MKTFAKNITTTFLTQIIILFIGVGTSVVLARSLGPEGKGLYSLAILLPTFVITFTNLGIGPATVYHTAKGTYNSKQIFGNNILLSLVVGFSSLAIGLVVINLFGEVILPGLPKSYATVALLLIPLTLIAENLKNILLGLQKIQQTNILSASRFILRLSLITVALIVLQGGVSDAIKAVILALVIFNALTFLWVFRSLKGVVFNINFSYIKSVTTYGVQAHLGNILGYLNYRIDIFLVNLFLNPLSVGLYSIAVGISEQLWLASKATSEVLLPKIAAEKDKKARKEFTPIISRNILWLTAIGAAVLFFLVKSIFIFLYSTDFLASVRPLQILLPGIVAVSASRILANDIAARGKPLINSYLSFFALVTNVGLNIYWIPRFGINGAALATTVSYSATLIGRVFIYSRISGNSVVEILIPQLSDLILYKRFGSLAAAWVRKRLIRG